MKSTILEVTGGLPVRFDGELLAEVVDPPPITTKASEKARWHELRLYRHQDGRIVLGLGFRSRHENDVPNNEVFVFASLDDMQRQVLGDDFEYDPADYVHGYPLEWPGQPNRAKAFAARQQRLVERIHDDFNARLTQLLAAANVTEEL